MPDASRSLSLTIRGLARALGWRPPADRRLPSLQEVPHMRRRDCQTCGRPATIALTTGTERIEFCGTCYGRAHAALKAKLKAAARKRRRNGDRPRPKARPQSRRLPL